MDLDICRAHTALLVGSTMGFEFCRVDTKALIRAIDRCRTYGNHVHTPKGEVHWLQFPHDSGAPSILDSHQGPLHQLQLYWKPKLVHLY